MYSMNCSILFPEIRFVRFPLIFGILFLFLNNLNALQRISLLILNSLTECILVTTFLLTEMTSRWNARCRRMRTVVVNYILVMKEIVVKIYRQCPSRLVARIPLQCKGRLTWIMKGCHNDQS